MCWGPILGVEWKDGVSQQQIAKMLAVRTQKMKLLSADMVKFN
jgi:hypothetical protein